MWDAHITVIVLFLKGFVSSDFEEKRQRRRRLMNELFWVEVVVARDSLSRLRWIDGV